MNETGFDFRNKFALLDTNILKAFLSGDKKSARYNQVLEFLAENNSLMYVLKNVTDFEFTGYQGNKKLFDASKEWLESNFILQPPLPQDYDRAAQLSSMYRCKNPSISPKQISFADCLYAAQLLRVRERAFIVTTDLNDYPSFLFDMPMHFAIEEEGGNTTFVGLKTLNTQKFKELELSFSKSG